MNIYFDKLVVVKLPFGRHQFKCSDSSLTIQAWGSTNGDRIEGGCTMIKPREGSGAIIFFCETADLGRVTDPRNGYTELQTVGYQMMSYSNGEWVPVFFRGLSIESYNQYVISVDGVELHTAPRGVISRQHMVDFIFGRESLADLILIDWRLRAQSKLVEALDYTKKLKNAMGAKFESSSAANVQQLITEVLRI